MDKNLKIIGTISVSDTPNGFANRHGVAILEDGSQRPMTTEELNEYIFGDFDIENE